jgi:Fur family ferric uptake transcriptional regulator
LHADLTARGASIGLATVYRSLALMVEAGEVDVLTREDGTALYLRCGGQHHHHLVCRSCGHAIMITGPDVERWARAEAARHGYTDVSHSLEVFGLCPRCSSPGADGD